MGYQPFWARKDALLAALHAQRTRDALLCAALLVTDLATQVSAAANHVEIVRVLRWSNSSLAL